MISIFFLLFSSPNLSGRRLDVYAYFHTWCGLSANFECMYEMRCTLLAENTGGFRYSYIVPLPKPKECYSKTLTCDDFRGIAISPVLSKVFEHCMLDRFGSFLKTSDNQFGFKKGLWCSFAIRVVHNVVDGLTKGGSTVNLCA